MQTLSRGAGAYEPGPGASRAWPANPRRRLGGPVGAGKFRGDEDAARAAPPVMVFDAAGNFIKAWGGAGLFYCFAAN